MLPHQVTPQVPATVEVTQTEAALTEHYARLARLAFLLLPAGLPRQDRVRTAHALTQRALPWTRVPDEARDAGPAAPEGRCQDADPGYASLRVRLVRGALEAKPGRQQRPKWARWLPPRPLLPLVWGLRLLPRPGGEAEFLLDRRLAALDGPARAAVVLRTLEGLSTTATRRVLAAAGVTDPDPAIAAAARLTARATTGTVPGQRDRPGTDRVPPGGRRHPAHRPSTGETIVPAPQSGAPPGSQVPGHAATQPPADPAPGTPPPPTGTARKDGDERPGTERPGHDRPDAGRPDRRHPKDERPEDERPEEGRPGEERPRAERRATDRPGGRRPDDDRPEARWQAGGRPPSHDPVPAADPGQPTDAVPARPGDGTLHDPYNPHAPHNPHDRPGNDAPPTPHDPPAGATSPPDRPGDGTPCDHPAEDAVPDLRADIAALMRSDAFDPCSLQARPTDILRRRQRVKTGLVGLCAALVLGPMLLPEQHDTHHAARKPPVPPRTARAVLDPDRLITVDPAAWRTATRTDYSVWPARGNLTEDEALLRRALTAWAGPGKRVRVSATPGTPTGAPPGPAQLLYAGELGHARVVLLYDGLRLARYTERANGRRHPALQVARADGAGAAEATAVVVRRTRHHVRYLSAPWVRAISVVDLLDPQARPAELPRSHDGVTAAAPAVPRSGACDAWPALEVRDAHATRLVTDLGEPVPAHLTSGRPTAPHEAGGRAARTDWGHVGCLLRNLRDKGVRTVNSWRYAEETLPDAGGVASWLCTRADTWRGTGSRVMVGIQIPERTTSPVVAAARDSPACGPRAPQVLAGVLWKSAAGTWYLLAAGSDNVVGIVSHGAVHGRVSGPILAVQAEQGARPQLTGRLADGTPVTPPH